MKAIVTGAGGLIGSRFIELYGEEFEKIYQLGRTRASIDAEWIDYDLESDQPVDLPVVDVLFHFAGQTSIYQAKDDVFYDLKTNVLGLLHILEALRQSDNNPFVVLAGTATEVGFTDTSTPIDESYCNRPITFYDISKQAGENYLLQYVKEGWISGCSLRLCNVYGGSKNGQNTDRGIIDKIFQKAIAGDPIRIFGDGDYLRDYIHIDDVVSAFFLAWENRNQVNGKYFNIGTGRGVSLKDAFHLIARIAEEVNGRKVEVSSVNPPADLSQIEFRSFVADNTRFVEATGWNSKYELEQGIRFSYGKYFNAEDKQ